MVSIWGGLILLAVFITDSTYTLLRRMASGTRWYEPHRSHAYQHATRRFGNHASVTLAVLALNIGWLLPCAWLASRMPQRGEFVAMLAVLPLLILVYRFGAGRDT